MSAASPSSRVLALVFTDLVDSTALKTERGDEAGGALIARHRDLLVSLAREHGGRVVDFAGDGAFLTFGAPSAAALFALALQAAHARERELPGVRVGIHLGEVSERANRVEGLAVDLAARVQSLACPGQVLLSAAAAGSARQRLPRAISERVVSWRNHGAFALKGASEPLEIHEVGLTGIAPFSPPQASEKARPAWRPRGAGIVRRILSWFSNTEGPERRLESHPSANSESPRAEPAAPTPSPIRSLAVLPLANLSRDPDQEFFADGMTETLIAELAKLPSVRVISRTSVMQFKGAAKPLREIARALDVEGVIEGSVMRSGGDVRITAQLIDARSDAHVWAEQYDRELARVLEIQREVARAVAREIQLALTPQQAARFAAPKPVDPPAQEAYFRGLALRRWDEPALRASIAAFEEATRIASDFAPPYAALANSRHVLTLVYAADPRVELPKAQSEAQRAVSLDPQLGDAHAALGGILFRWDWDFAASDQAFARGLALGVSDPANRAIYGSLLLSIGRASEAFRWLEAVVASAPLDTLVRDFFASLLSNGGEYERAIHEATRSLEVDPSDRWARLVRALCYERTDRFEEAIREHQAVARVTSQWESVARNLESAWRSAGRDGYWRWLQGTYDAVGNNFLAAAAYAETDSIDQAFAALERAYESRDTRMPFLVSFAALTPLHSDPRFADLARRMNLPLPRGALR